MADVIGQAVHVKPAKECGDWSPVSRPTATISPSLRFNYPENLPSTTPLIIHASDDVSTLQHRAVPAYNNAIASIRR